MIIEAVLAEISSHKNIPLIEISLPASEDEIQTLSAGEILTYIKCPYFYRLRELWNYKPGLVEALGYGKILHFCLRYASELIKEGIDPKIAIEEAVDEKFYVPYAGGKAKKNMKKKAKEVLSKFVGMHKEEMGKIEEVEARIEFPLQKATITGKVDVILKDENTMEVRDYKTSEEVTTYDQASLQVQLYTFGLKGMGKPITQASIAYLEKENPEEQIKKVSIENKDLNNAKRKAKEYIECIMRGEFKAKPENGYCKHCDQKEICRYTYNMEMGDEYE